MLGSPVGTVLIISLAYVKGPSCFVAQFTLRIDNYGLKLKFTLPEFTRVLFYTS